MPVLKTATSAESFKMVRGTCPSHVYTRVYTHVYTHVCTGLTPPIPKLEKLDTVPMLPLLP